MPVGRELFLSKKELVGKENLKAKKKEIINFKQLDRKLYSHIFHKVFTMKQSNRKTGSMTMYSTVGTSNGSMTTPP